VPCSNREGETLVLAFYAVLVACNQGGPATGKGTDAAALALILDDVKGLR